MTEFVIGTLTNKNHSTIRPPLIILYMDGRQMTSEISATNSNKVTNFETFWRENPMANPSPMTPFRVLPTTPQVYDYLMTCLKSAGQGNEGEGIQNVASELADVYCRFGMRCLRLQDIAERLTHLSHAAMSQDSVGTTEKEPIMPTGLFDIALESDQAAIQHAEEQGFPPEETGQFPFDVRVYVAYRDGDTAHMRPIPTLEDIGDYSMDSEPDSEASPVYEDDEDDYMPSTSRPEDEEVGSPRRQYVTRSGLRKNAANTHKKPMFSLENQL